MIFNLAFGIRELCVGGCFRFVSCILFLCLFGCFCYLKTGFCSKEYNMYLNIKRCTMFKIFMNDEIKITGGKILYIV